MKGQTWVQRWKWQVQVQMGYKWTGRQSIGCTRIREPIGESSECWSLRYTPGMDARLVWGHITVLSHVSNITTVSRGVVFSLVWCVSDEFLGFPDRISIHPTPMYPHTLSQFTITNL